MSMPITLKLHRSLYALECVEEAIVRFASCATIQHQIEEDQIRVDFLKIHPKLSEEIVDIFCNQILQDTIQSIRHHREV